MKNFENEISKVNEAISHKAWCDDVVLFDVDGDLCMDISDCREWESDIEDCLNTLLCNEGIDITAVCEDDYFYCDYCKKNHYVTNGMKNNRVIISEYGDVACRFCLSWAEKENYDLAEEYMEHLINNPTTANEFLTDGFLQDHGFTKVDDEYSCGLYECNHNDNPMKIFEEYERNGYDVVFNIKNSNPYETEFSVYIKEVE